MGRSPTGGFRGGLARGGQKRGLQADFQAAIVQEIETLLGRQAVQGLDFEALETAVRQQALQVAARALERWLNADTSDHTGSHLPCACGATAQYRGRHGKSFQSVLGALHLQRAYYYCPQCQSGFCPRDRALSLEDFSLSPAVLRMVGSAATLVSFVESSTLLRELAGVEVNAKQVERAAEALGQEIAQTSGSASNRCPRPRFLPLSIWAWTAPEFPCAPRHYSAARASKKMVRPKLARSNWSPSGVPNRKTRMGYPFVTKDP